MKIIPYILLFILSAITLLYIGYTWLDEPLPEGQSGEKAEMLAQKMLEAVQDSAWQQTGVVRWEFSGASLTNSHVWDRKRHYAQVTFGEHTVQIDINNRTGRVLDPEAGLSHLEQVEYCEKAWRLWANDSFWLNPISKIYDKGTERKVVDLGGGTQGLLVTYMEGGVTPGDSYLWLLDENHRPQAWKFWVSIVPIGGMEFTWQAWQQLNTGAWVSTYHDGLLDIYIRDVQGYASVDDLPDGDLFEGLETSTVKF